MARVKITILRKIEVYDGPCAFTGYVNEDGSVTIPFVWGELVLKDKTLFQIEE